MAKAKKKRADKYDGKLSINASFEDTIKLSATPYTPQANKADMSKKGKK